MCLEVFRIAMIISTILWSGHVTHVVQKRNAINSDEPNPEAGAIGTVQWRTCSLPMELSSGSEFATDFEGSLAETKSGNFLKSKAQMGR